MFNTKGIVPIVNLLTAIFHIYGIILMRLKVSNQGVDKMSWLITKYICTAAIVVIISEFAKRSDRLGALIGAMPLMTLIALFWLYFEKQPQSKITNHAYYTFWYVIPTLPMFFMFPILYPKLGFWMTIGASVVITAVCFILVAMIVKRFGIELML
jgi:hypothetical protein